MQRDVATGVLVCHSTPHLTPISLYLKHMLSGTLTFEVVVEADSEGSLADLSASIRKAVQGISGVNLVAEVDSDIEDDGDSESE